METEKGRLKRWLLGEMPPRLKEKESEFFTEIVRKNCNLLALLALIGMMLQGVSFFSMRDKAIMRDQVMQTFALIVIIGLLIFSLFFYQQSKRKMPVATLLICQVVFMFYYIAVDLCVIFMNLQVQDGLLRLAPTIILGGMAYMTGGISIACFGIYAIVVPILAPEFSLIAYGVVSAITGFVFSRMRYSMLVNVFDKVQEKEEMEKERDNLAVQLKRIKTWDEDLKMNNRRAMSAWLEAVWPLCVRNKIPVAVLMIAPDHLEELSRNGSDELVEARISQFAEALKPFVRRQSDFIGRYDKFKFMILYSGLQRSDADRLINWMRTSISEKTWGDDPDANISFSLGGIYDIPNSDLIPAQWVTRADSLLAKALLQGSDTTILQELKHRY